LCSEEKGLVWSSDDDTCCYNQNEFSVCLCKNRL